MTILKNVFFALLMRRGTLDTNDLGSISFTHQIITTHQTANVIMTCRGKWNW